MFFFQAEDGIRDIGVTGVQTCALPIWAGLAGARPLPARDEAGGDGGRRGGPARHRVAPRGLIGPMPNPSNTFRAAYLPTVRAEIGRASCRERVEISVVAVSLKKKTSSR